MLLPIKDSWSKNLVAGTTAASDPKLGLCGFGLRQVLFAIVSAFLQFVILVSLSLTGYLPILDFLPQAGAVMPQVGDRKDCFRALKVIF